MADFELLEEKFRARLADKIPELIDFNRNEIKEAIVEKIRNHDKDSAPKMSFKIDAKVTFYGDSWALDLTLAWSTSIKKETDTITIDLQPELTFNEDE